MVWEISHHICKVPIFNIVVSLGLLLLNNYGQALKLPTENTKSFSPTVC